MSLPPFILVLLLLLLLSVLGNIIGDMIGELSVDIVIGSSSESNLFMVVENRSNLTFLVIDFWEEEEEVEREEEEEEAKEVDGEEDDRDLSNFILDLCFKIDFVI